MNNLTLLFSTIIFLISSNTWALTNSDMEELSDLYMRSGSQDKIAMLNKLSPAEAANVLVLVDVKRQKIELYLREQLQQCNR
ncbi:MAG: hypothetical protein FJ190_04755 [Gammaproteobacteria bacterium]|nr:hypothetical protein [Gammaproteobacteria bacterium]